MSTYTMPTAFPAIAIDEREADPWEFPTEAVVRKVLPLGGYSVEGYESEIAIVHATLDSLESNPPTREQMQAAKAMRFAAVVLSANVADVWAHRGDVEPSELYGRIVHLTLNGLPVLFAADERHARELTQRLLHEWWTRRKHRTEEAAE